MLDEQLILLGNDNLGTRGRYISVQKPRNGLLAMKYTIQDLPLRQFPHRHSSFVSKNGLTVIGGKFKSRGSLSRFTWTELSLKWKNGSKFNPDFSAACTVKLGVDAHINFGGERKINDKKMNGRQVVKINTTEQFVVEMNPMLHRRVSHDCQLLNNSIVLVSGGLDPEGEDPYELQDELYNITSEETVNILDLRFSLRRSQHSMIRIGDQIFALGGRDSNNDAVSKIAVFNATTNAWNDLNQELHSSSTSELVVSPFPISAFDCVPECRCGEVNRGERVFKGSAAKVRSVLSLQPAMSSFQENAFPWIAALLRDDDIYDGYINSKCGAVLASV